MNNDDDERLETEMVMFINAVFGGVDGRDSLLQQLLPDIQSVPRYFT